MKKTSAQRFTAWAVLVSLGWFSFLWSDGLGLLFFLAAWFLAMPREELGRVVPRRELLWIAGILFAFIAVLVAVTFFARPSAERAVESSSRHPAIIIALWLLCLGIGFRGWCRKVHKAS